MLTAHILTASERLIPLAFFALYLITSVQIIRYSSWLAAGAPNPFLSDQLRRVWRRSDVGRELLVARIKITD